MLDTAKPKKGY